jgi:hypothetical protein
MTATSTVTVLASVVGSVEAVSLEGLVLPDDLALPDELAMPGAGGAVSVTGGHSGAALVTGGVGI